MSAQNVIDWNFATRPCPGQAVSGDRHLVQPFSNGILIAVVDGLGHGPEATNAAKIAISTLASHAGESVIALVNHCHQALTSARGVVMTVASLNLLDGTVSWIGVGNVEGLMLHAAVGASPRSERVLLRGGLVGYQLPPLYASVIPVSKGDLLIFVSDGIRNDFAAGLKQGNDAPQQIAKRILAQSFKGNDDALVLVVRYMGTRYE